MVAIYLRYESNYLLYNGVIESYMAFITKVGEAAGCLF